MHPRQPLPRLWLMTDERLGEDLIPAIGRLPTGSGIVFRHYRVAPSERRSLFEQARAAADAGGHKLLLAGPADEAREWGADGSHGRGPSAGGLRSAPVHDYLEMRVAEWAKVDLVFVSPVFATRSHPGRRPLGVAKFAWLARRTTLPVIALGGMNPALGKRLASFGAYGWAAIDAWAAQATKQINTD